MDNFYLYIVLTRPNTLISKLIQTFKNDEYTHAAIALDKDLQQMYSFGRKYTSNPFIGVFKQENINRGIYKLCNTLPGAIIEIEVSRRQYQKAKKLIEHFVVNKDYYKYNYLGLVYNMFNKSVCCENRFLCSEFVYYVLAQSGAANLEKSRNLIRPQDLLHLNGKVVFQGDIKEFSPLGPVWKPHEMLLRDLRFAQVRVQD